jgi:penicillin-binding protein 1C
MDNQSCKSINASHISMSGKHDISDSDISCGRRPRRGRKAALAAAALGMLPLFIGWLQDGEPILKEYPSATMLMDRQQNPLRLRLGEHDLDCRPVSLDLTGTWAAQALIAAEDTRFYYHPGIDPLAIVRSLGLNVMKGRIVSGASTISTQVIKMDHPRPRTLKTKLLEAVEAMRMEWALTKQQILEQYLNRAPFGSNLAGLESASQRYFGKHAADLNLAEAALLVGLPKSPSRYRPDRHPTQALRRRQEVLQAMRARGMITQKQYKAASGEPLNLHLRPGPFRAPHFCDLVLSATHETGSLATSLDEQLQALTEAVVVKNRKMLRDQGVFGTAIVVLDVRTGTVRALVGSPDYYDAAHAGQVNGATAPRSPGSALKPFVYAMALDDGRITPESMLNDVPIRFREYVPRNFDTDFSGPVSAREALIRSLNIPALELTQQTGTSRLLEQLRRLSLQTLDKSASHYGLGLILGGGEVTLLDLANAYACLARDGVFKPWSLFETPSSSDMGVHLFSPEAAFLIADMLSGEERASGPQRQIAGTRTPRMAWKTGTSTGFRDAWTFAWNPEYVVGVWVGNPDGRPMPEQTGSTAAAPLAFELFRSIYPNGDAPWFEPPPGLRQREVCSVSGQCPGAQCHRKKMDYYLPGISHGEICSIHQGRARSPSGPRTAETAVPTNDESEESWPVEIQSFLRTKGMLTSERNDSAGVQLRITAPADGQSYIKLTEVAGVQQELPLSVAAPIVSKKLFWFANGRRFAELENGQTAYWPLEKGEWTLTCCDEEGKSDSIHIRVK